MPDRVKEKLVELVNSVLRCLPWGEISSHTAEDVADHLIANGVTVRDNTQITDEFLEQLRNTPVTILQEEPTIEVVQEWISVKDRLPSTFTDVISYNAETASFQVDCLDERGKWYSEYKYSDYSPTHWMPLPQPPKGE